MEDAFTKSELAYAEFIYKPSLFLRIKSVIIDNIVVLGLIFIAAALINKLEIESGGIKGIVLLIILLYEPILVTLGGTIGQRILKLRIINASEYKKNGKKKNINILSSLLRYITKLFLGWISLLTIHSDKLGQAIHDKSGNSIMAHR